MATSSEEQNTSDSNIILIKNETDEDIGNSYYDLISIYFSKLNISEEYKFECDYFTTSNAESTVVRKPPPLDLDTLPIEDNRISKISYIVKARLQELISEYPEGIWCSKIPRMYRNKFNEELEPIQFGFVSVIQLCDDLPDVFYSIRPGRGDWMIYDITKPIPSIDYINRNVDTSPENTAMPNPVLPECYLYPNCIVQIGETIARQWLFDCTQIDDLIEIEISQIHNPSKFWIVIRTVFETLIEMMKYMHNFYLMNPSSLKLNKFNVKRGLLCSTLFHGKFYRALVVKIIDANIIKVFYIDFGTVGRVELKNTFFLHRDFAYIPMQAIKASLFNLMPFRNGSKWSKDASLRFCELSLYNHMIAQLYVIDSRDKTVSLSIVDSANPDVTIENILIEEGFAKRAGEVRGTDYVKFLTRNWKLYDVKNSDDPTSNP